MINPSMERARRIIRPDLIFVLAARGMVMMMIRGLEFMDKE